VHFDKLSAQIAATSRARVVQTNRTHKWFSRLRNSGGTLGCGWPRWHPQGGSEPVESARDGDGEPELTNAPEGGNTTQCGDPAPGPM
jgi:hypothetical protein